MDTLSPVMYIVINDELNMSPGKIASQVSHVVQIVVDELVSEMYENIEQSEHIINYIKWKSEPTTIILKASGYKFNRLLELDTARFFKDYGKTTQNTNDQITAIAFYPSNKLKDDFVGYKLVS